MALANDEALRKQFRRANFHGGMLSVRQGLMTEAEAVQQEQDDIDSIIANASCSHSCNLSFARLTSVPEKLLDLTDLTRLNLESNSISKLPDDFGGSLCFLVELTLRRNRIHNLPVTLCMLDSLEVLDISNNLITHLPVEFADMTALRKLVADFNYFEDIPECIFHGMPQLEQLFLIENPLILQVPERLEEWGVQQKRICEPLGEEPKKTLSIELDNSPELVASIERLISNSPPEFASGLQIKYNKIWPDMVVDHVALGSLRTVQNMSAVNQLNVSHVLTCGRNLQTPKFPAPIKQLILDVDDSDEQDMNQYFLKAIEFINDCVAQKGLCIVHCFAGVSRSATVVVAYLMMSRHWKFEEALDFVQQHRPAANPNPNFRRQLIEFESMCT